VHCPATPTGCHTSASGLSLAVCADQGLLAYTNINSLVSSVGGVASHCHETSEFTVATQQPGPEFEWLLISDLQQNGCTTRQYEIYTVFQ